MKLLSFNSSYWSADRAMRRLLQLRAMVSDLEIDVGKGALELEARYARAVDDAAFLLEALDHSEHRRLSSKVDPLTRTIALYSQEIADLKRMSDVLSESRARLDAFVGTAGNAPRLSHKD
jgi:hypothetical protein